jgi:predicted small lipoprotein YifL
VKKEMSAVSILFALAAAGQAGPAPQPPSACTAAEYRQFDFWVGEWNVTQNGKQAGTSRIERILDGCAVFENWTGAGGSRGNSLNYYDAGRGMWHQTWIDNQGSPLELEGRFETGSMVLVGNTHDAASGKMVVNRISWTPQAEGTVRQHWETSTDGGKSWTTAFDGRYARK